MLCFCIWAILKPDPKTVYNHADAQLLYVECKIEKVMWLCVIRLFEKWFTSKPIKFLNREKNDCHKRNFLVWKIINISKCVCSEEKCVNSLPDPYVMIFLQ